MTRRCSHCTSPIEPHDAFTDGVMAGQLYAAWLAGYCTTMCQRNAALTTVAHGNAWWQTSAVAP